MEGYASLPTTVVSDPLDSQTTRLGAVITPPDSRSVTPPPRRNVPTDGAFPPIDRQSSRTPLLVSKPLSPPSSESDSPGPTSPISPSRPTRIRSLSHSTEPECEAPVLPTALHANFLTSCIGFATFVLLWIPIPLLHWIGWEAFRWPGQQGGNVWEIWAGLEVVAWGGAVYVSLTRADRRDIPLTSERRADGAHRSVGTNNVVRCESLDDWPGGCH